MPQWLIDILIQYPIVAVVGLVAWYAYWQVKSAFDESQDRSDKLQALLVTAKDEEIKRLRDDLTAEIRKLAKKVDDLAKKLS